MNFFTTHPDWVIAAIVFVLLVVSQKIVSKKSKANRIMLARTRAILNTTTNVIVLPDTRPRGKERHDEGATYIWPASNEDRAYTWSPDLDGFPKNPGCSFSVVNQTYRGQLTVVFMKPVRFKGCLQGRIVLEGRTALTLLYLDNSDVWVAEVRRAS